MGTMRSEGKWIYLEFRYNPDIIAKVKALASMYGVKGAWNPKDKTWKLPFYAAGHIASELPSFGRDREIELAYREMLSARNARADMKYLECDPDDLVTDERKLFKHQREGVELLWDRSLILAHDMGLGKTLTSLVAAKGWLSQTDVELVVIVCPA